MDETTIDTLPLLRLLDSVSHQMLSRGEIKRNGISDNMIDEAERLDQIIVNSTDDTRNGKLSSFASVLLLDAGEAVLDAADLPSTTAS